MTGPDDAPPFVLSSTQLHDLRTPLGQIIGYAELLAETVECDDDSRADLQKISAAGYRMLALVERIFTAAGASADGVLTWDDVDLLRGVADGSRTLSAEDAERLTSVAAHLATLLPPRP